MTFIEIISIVISVLILFVGNLAFMLNLINGVKSDIKETKSDIKEAKSDMKDYFELRLKAELSPINEKLGNHITDTNKQISLLKQGQKTILEKLDTIDQSR